MTVRKRGQIFAGSMLTLLFCLQDATSSNSEVKTLRLLMPDVQLLQAEIYLCTAFKMPSNDFEYIVEFHPKATMQIAHNILIYGCGLPGRYLRGKPRFVWDCGEMREASSISQYTSGLVCDRGAQTIYGWALDAPALKLPEGVGFKVGKGTGIDYLVLQVHYANVDSFPNGLDNSGIILKTLPSKNRRVTKYAGVYTLGAYGDIPSEQGVYMETACAIKQAIEMHPFAFRIQTRALGKVVSGYKIDEGGKWHLIGKHSPQAPQMFYPVEDENLVIRQNDTVAARCTMYNFRSRGTVTGPTIDDEVCNFFIMYYVDDDELLSDKSCFSSGPPGYSWMWNENIGYVPLNIHESASRLD